MSRIRRWTFPLLLLSLLALSSALASAAAPLRPLETAIVDPAVFTGPDAAAGLDRARAAGAGAIKVPLFWNEVAPATRPSGFKPADPSQPAYNWSQLDAELRLIHAHGLEPIVYISSAPTWAFRTIDGALRPDPQQYQAFALAAVRRYSGDVAGLPRVRYWQAWNEPNKVANPSFKPGAADWYRALVNSFAASVHSHAGNAVIAGGLSPFGISTAIAPLTFMRSLLCESSGSTPHSTCSTPVHFDIWSTDPYTAGGPDHQASRPGDVSVAELPEMKAVLDAGVRAGHVIPTQPVRFWVTEFSWDSDPPDPGGVPAALEGRWVAEALYRMWNAGVSLVTWFTLRDQPLATSPYQSGLYFLGSSFAHDRPKPAFTAFRFPFVAFPGAKSIAVWGRTPAGVRGAVVVEQHGASGWKQVAALQANGVGIFSAKLVSTGRGPLRALFPAAHAVSLSFSLVSPPDHAYQPFGSTLTGTAAQSKSNSSAVSQYVETVPTAAGGSSGTAIASGKASAPPGSTISAITDAIGSANTRDVLIFVAAILLVTLSLGASAVRRRRFPPDSDLMQSNE